MLTNNLDVLYLLKLWPIVVCSTLCQFSKHPKMLLVHSIFLFNWANFIRVRNFTTHHLPMGQFGTNIFLRSVSSSYLWASPIFNFGSIFKIQSMQIWKAWCAYIFAAQHRLYSFVLLNILHICDLFFIHQHFGDF